MMIYASSYNIRVKAYVYWGKLYKLKEAVVPCWPTSCQDKR